MLEINTSKLSSRKHVVIDDHPYVVRKYGAGEQLTLNQLFRRASQIEKKVEDGTVTEDEEQEVVNISEKMINILAGLFDDGGDGTKSKELVSTLNQFEVQELFSQIFGEESDATATVS